MKYRLYTLITLCGLFLSSCSKETLGNEASIEQSEGKTQTVKMSLGAGFTAFNREGLEESPESELKALERQNIQFEITDGKNKFILNDDGGKSSDRSKRGHVDTEDLKAKAANIKFYVQVRKKNTTTIVGSLHRTWVYGTWNNDGTYVTDWRLNGVDIPLRDVNPGTDELQVRVVAGGSLDTDQGKILITEPEYKVLDLSKTNQVSLPVPFVSNWIDLSYNAAKAQYTTVNDAKIKLKPLGVLLVTTVRSSMAQPTSLTGIRYVSNALAFQGEFTLDGSDNVPFTAVGGRKFTTDVTEDSFYEVTYNFTEAETPGRKPSDKLIVSWGLPTGKPEAVTWQTNNGGNPKDPSSINWQRADLTPMISMPQTHAYAEGVSNPGHTNFKVVPVMGTNHNFGHGKTAAINCELYDVPRQVLGYFAHYTVNADGTGFDKSHDDDKVSLVNWKVAKDFLKGKQLTGPNGEIATYSMGNTAMAVYTTTYFSSAWATNNAGVQYRRLEYNDPSKGTVVARSRPVYVNKGTDEHPNIVSEYRYLMQVYIPKKKDNVQYMIVGRNFENDKKKVIRSKSKDQVVIRIEADHAPRNMGANEPFSIGAKTFTSVALGKYFVGTAYSPIYDNKSAYDEDLWSSQVFLKGRVMRRMPAPGNYYESSWNIEKNPTDVADVDDIYPKNRKRHRWGDVSIYWIEEGYKGTGLMMNKLHKGQNQSYNGAQWLLDGDVFTPSGNVLYVPFRHDGGLYNVNRDAKYMWQALWPIANKYQGDNIDPD